MAQPISAAAITWASASEPTSKRSRIATTAPLMTELSYPKRKPPMAAAAVMKMTWPRWSGWGEDPPPDAGVCAVLLVKVCSVGVSSVLTVAHSSRSGTTRRRGTAERAYAFSF